MFPTRLPVRGFNYNAERVAFAGTLAQKRDKPAFRIRWWWRKDHRIDGGHRITKNFSAVGVILATLEATVKTMKLAHDRFFSGVMLVVSDDYG